MLPISPTSQAFEQDQTYSFTVDTWDTPFAALDGDSASLGFIASVRQPTGNGGFNVRAAVQGASAAGSAAAFAGSTSSAVFTNGRIGNLINYWAAGAPAQHGANYRQQVAYQLTGYYRNPDWFGAPANVRFVVGGSGYLRIVKNQSTIVYEDTLTEAAFLVSGLSYSNAVALAPGDRIDVYYVQDREAWGGFVVKLYAGAGVPTAQELREAPVLGPSLFGDNADPVKQSLTMITGIEVARNVGQAAQAQLRARLINPSMTDEIGWEYCQDSEEDPGYLVLHDDAGDVTVRRGRLVRIKAGYQGEENTVFTGVVDDIQNVASGEATIVCRGLEQRLVEQLVKNYPDKISYMAFNYRQQLGTSEPVWEIAAYDNWPIEYAVRDLMLRGGLDDSRTRQTLSVPLDDGTAADVDFGTSTLFKKFRARTLSGSLLTLERPVHYGNTGLLFNEDQPVDGEYIFKPEAQKDLWAAVQGMTDRYGLDCTLDEQGHAILQSRNNPHTIVDLTTSIGGTRKQHPAAFGGTYIELTGTPTVTLTVTAARIDVVVGRFAGSGTWSYTVKRTSDMATVRSGTIDPADTTDLFFYDARTTIDGTNTCAVTVHSGQYDEYQVQLVGAVAGTRRLDSLLLYHTDPVLPRLPEALTTGLNALRVEAQSAMTDMRNLVIVVGRRRAVVTDSAKLDTNPENPQGEFVVQSAVDVASIVDPTAVNFVGFPREAVIYDSGITDDDFATYLARTFIYRYRTPRPQPAIEHTLLHVLQLRDPLYAVEETYGSVSAQKVVYVSGFTHRISAEGASTSVTTSSYPEFPSYEPRKDIDIDDPALGYAGQPVVNVSVDYTSLTGHAKSNLGLNEALSTAGAEHIVTGLAVNAGSPWPYLDLTGQAWPPIPGSLFIKAAAGTGAQPDVVVTYPSDINEAPRAYGFNVLAEVRLNGFQSITSVQIKQYSKLDSFASGTPTWVLDKTITVGPQRSVVAWYEYSPNTEMLRVLIGDNSGFVLDNPQESRYQVIITYKPTDRLSDQGFITNHPYHHLLNVDYRDSNRRVYLPWNMGDGRTPYQRSSNHTAYDVRYRALGTDYAGGESPFYDPTTSELGYLVNVTFDTLVSGLYRISIRSVEDDTVVAWLTEPGADPNETEQHWQFISAAAGRSLAWDGVDQVGTWNQRQSEQYANAATGAFEQGSRPIIGAGFYVWNKEERTEGAFAPQALIAGTRDATTGKPVFGHGPYARWYVKFECKSDELQRAFDADPTNLQKALPRVVDTRELDENLNGSPSAVIYTHLPEPTRVELKVSDWVGGAFDRSNTTAINNPANWGAADADASINTEKPVRLRFTIQPRPGVLWASQQDRAQVRLLRHVHLKASIYDQFVVYKGVNYAGTAYEDRTVVNRKLTNDDHTLLLEDEGYRTGSSFKQTDGGAGTEWIFLPDDFKKDFRGRANEPLQFGDYLQLEEVPSWDTTGATTSARSRLQLAFMSYLFYLSVYTQDRSGRFVWAINRSFLDKSKILKNAYGDWQDPSDPSSAATSGTYRLDWPDDPQTQQRRTIVTRQWTNEPGWQAAQRARYGLTVGSVGDHLLRHKWQDHEATSSTINGVTWASLASSLQIDGHSKFHAVHTRLPSTFNDMDRQLGDNGQPSALGAWTWESDPLWVPCITRDFHGYYCLPPMVDKPGVEDTSGDYSDRQYVSGAGGSQATNWRGDYIYGVVSMQKYRPTENTGDDAAMSDVWNSVIWDMTSAYSNNDDGSDRRQFWPGTRVKKGTEPSNPLQANTLDYLRQDSMTHYEDLRGMFTRGARPGEQAKKIAPVLPYYINPYRYDVIDTDVARKQPEYPVFIAEVLRWFQLTFRSEYLWESGSLFPTTVAGDPRLDAINPEKSRVLQPNQLKEVRFDAGAWVGWKDDTPNSGEADTTNYVLKNDYTSVFDSGMMPVATGPRLAVTTDVYMHMVLVNERRTTPLSL